MHMVIHCVRACSVQMAGVRRAAYTLINSPLDSLCVCVCVCVCVRVCVQCADGWSPSMCTHAYIFSPCFSLCVCVYMCV